MKQPCKPPIGPCSDAGGGDPGFTDPRVALCFYSQSYYDIIVAANAIVRLALNNPNRVALGFSANFATGTANAAPWSDVSTIGALPIVTDTLNWITMTDLGVVVCGEWYGRITAAGRWRIIEVNQRIGSRRDVRSRHQDRPEPNASPVVRFSRGGGGPVIDPG